MKQISLNKRPMPGRRGFTLVEMLIATALVLLMMLLFAQVFQTAAGLVSNQKGMAELDQNVRTLTILLRGDIKQRTFMDVVPFVREQDTSNAAVPGYNEITGKGYDAAFRRGFFSISENDVDDNTDDVLHMTIHMDSPLSTKIGLPYSAKARLLRNAGSMDTDDQYLLTNPDQPEFDDGQLTVNGTGSSRYAEVCWFLRNGNLYRRMLLIRDPYADSSTPEDPQDSAGAEYIPNFYDADLDGTPDNFWRDFDYSAYWDPGENYVPTDPMSDPNDPNDPSRGLKFHALPQALENTDAGNLSQFGGLPRSLGVPFLRFGSSISRLRADDSQILGPREHIVDSVDSESKFIGRYTMQESVDTDFRYPGDYSFATDPFNANMGGPSLSIDPDESLNPTGLVTPYANGFDRRGEDLVMSNVHEFDIQVWDDGLPIPQFVNLGHGNGGHYGSPTTPPTTDLPWGPFGNRYDTWHPSEFMPEPPYAPFMPNSDARDNSVPTLPARGLGDDGEVWLKAIRIKIRFFDVGSDQMRDLTFTFALNRQNSSK